MVALRSFSFSVSAVLLAATLSLFSPISASAADGDGNCDLTGSGTAGSPWMITSQADLLEIGIGDCQSTYNQSQYYKLANDIELTGNWTPIELYTSTPVISHFNGDGHTIYGLNVTGSNNYAGLFSNIRSATVMNLHIEGTSVSGGTWVGALAGNVVESTIQSVTVRMTGNVSGAQNVGGVIGKAYGSSIQDIAFYSQGEVSGTSYCGGAIGGAENTSVQKVYVKTNTNFSNIGGGVIGSFTQAADSQLNFLYFDGHASADQYSGGLIGYLWATATSNAIIAYSGVVGIVDAKTNYDPAALVGQVGSNITGLTATANFIKAQFRKNTSSTPSVVTSVVGRNGSGTYTDTSNSNFYVATGGSSIAAGFATEKDVTVVANLTPSWNPITQTTWSTVNVASYRWVVDTSGATNGGLPMPSYLYNSKYFETWCAPGTYGTDGITNCTPAVAGKFVPYYGATAPINCPVGTFQANAQATSCDPAPAGYYIASTASTEATPCPPGTYQSLVGQSVCVNTSAGHFTDLSGSENEEACPAGYYQPNTNQTSCLPAQAGYYVGTTGATAQVQCDPGTESQAAAVSCYSLASGYSGPILLALRTKVAPGQKVKVSGSNLDGITSLTLSGLDCKVKVISHSEMEISIPDSIESGTFDAVVTSNSGQLTVQDFVIVQTGSKSDATAVNIRTWTKKLDDSSAKIYASNIVGAGKVQFFLNGKEIAWANAASAADSKLRTANGSSYLVRTVEFAAGKNILEVYVDGVRTNRTAYTK